MSTSSTRRRSGSRHHTVEHEALSEIASEAEARMAAKRAARAEAREIRMREIERQQLEDQEKERLRSSNEVKKDSAYVPSYTSRRTGSDTIDDLKSELSDLNDKYIKTMTHNAQLDNDKQTLTFRVALLTEDLDDLKEANVELKRQLKDKTRDLEHKKKAHDLLQAINLKLQEQLKERDDLIEEHGLVFISDDISTGEEGDDEEEEEGEEEDDDDDEDGGEEGDGKKEKSKKKKKNSRLIRMDEEKKALEKLVKKLKQELDVERERRSATDRFKSHSPTPGRFSNGGGDVGDSDPNSHSELRRQLKEYKLKVSKAHQEMATLEGTVARLEAQAKRFKNQAESSERGEEELRAEKRKLQKQLREVENARSELEAERNHLLKRLERSKGAKAK